MAKKVRFPLEMEDGVEVRSVEELRENFSLERVLAYIADEKMLTWLRDRYEEDLAEAVETLDPSDPLLSKKVCEIFDVTCETQTEVDMELIAERNRKLALLKEFTSDSEILAHVDDVATTQDDLYDLLDEGKTEIYLCGEQFTIPLAKQGIHYIGVNQPMVVIRSSEPVDWEQKKIILTGIKYDEKYLKVIEKKNDNIDIGSAMEDEYTEEESRYYMICDMNSDGESKRTAIYDREDHFVVDLNENYKYVHFPVLHRNYVYFVASNSHSYELHEYDLLKRKEEIIPGDLDFSRDFLLKNDGIRACNDEWLVYNADEKIYVYDLKNKKMRMQKFGFKINYRYSFDGTEKECEIIDKYFFACNFSVRNAVIRINLKTFQNEDVIHEDQNTKIEGRLMKSGNNLYCFSNNSNKDLNLYCINGMTNLKEKFTIIFLNDRKLDTKYDSNLNNKNIIRTEIQKKIREKTRYNILDSVCYKNQIYFIVMVSEEFYDTDFIVVQLNLHSAKIEKMDELLSTSRSDDVLGTIKAERGILHYKVYHIFDRDSAIMCNSISIG